MATLHLLGTGAALADASRTTTMLAVATDDRCVAVDCGGDLAQRLLAHGLALAHLDALVLTHEHPDHVVGFPLLMQKLWLSGRRRPLPVCGPERALAQAQQLFACFDTSGWEGVPEARWRSVPLREDVLVWEDEAWQITGAPVRHSVPTLALRIEDRRDGGVVVYSADTEPCPALVHLARGADILVHEATGEFPGHSSAVAAAEVARAAEVGRLLLVHLPPVVDYDALVAARRRFPATDLGCDGDRFLF